MPETGTEKEAILTALNDAYTLIDWDHDRFYPTVEAALRHLEDDFKQMDKRSDITVHCVVYPYRRGMAVEIKAYQGKGNAFLLHRSQAHGTE